MYPPNRHPSRHGYYPSRSPAPQTAPQFAFQPQRAPFIPPTLSHEESSGSTFLADLTSVSIPPLGVVATSYIVKCDVCNADLTGRPRVHCLTCDDYDICSECHHFGRTTPTHNDTHRQQTLKPRDYPPNHRRSSAREFVAYRCDVCNKNLSAEARARCVECKNYDLCLDCNLVGEYTLKHRPSHSVNVITSHLDSGSSITLMTADHVPTPLLQKLLSAVFTYIDTSFAPTSTSLLEPAKLSLFYSTIGVAPDLNIGRFPNATISHEYSSLGCEFHLVSDSVGEIAARATPWTQDGLDTTPRSPALTINGWVRFFILTCWREPDLMHFVLSNALATGKVMHARKGEPYRLSVPREAFPKFGKVVRRH